MLSNHHTRGVWLSLLLFVALAAAQTWPMAAAPSHWSRTDAGDGALNIWVVSWVGHIIATHPTRLFEANIFYPEHLTLAYSEAMPLQGLLAAPILVAGGSAVLAYNLVLLAGLALTGWSFCLLIRHWTGSWSAGCVGGSLAAFNAFSLVQLTHLQFLHVEFIAPMLYAVDRLARAPRWRPALVLAGAFVLQALTSIYVFVFSIWMLGFAVLSRVGEWWRERGAMLSTLAATGGVALGLLSPYLSAYVTVHRAMGFTRTAGEEEAANWANYLSTAARVHYGRWSHTVMPEGTSATFPGVIAITLIVLACCDRETTRDRRFRMCAATAAGCAAVSFAPLLPFYRVLHSAIPLFQMVRVLPHIGQVVLLMGAVLAGFGVAAVQRAASVRVWTPVAVALTIAVNVEAARAPVGYVWFDRVPAVYDVLARDPVAVVAELPFPMPQQWFLNSLYMVNSTSHWRPMLNGYSGFRPGSYDDAYNLLRKFPADEALIGLSARGVTHIVVHQHAMNLGAGADSYNPFEKVPALQLVARDDDVIIYRLRR